MKDFVPLILIGVLAQALSPAARALAEESVPAPRPFGFSTLVESGSSLLETSDPAYSAYTDLWLNPSWHATPELTMGALFIVDQQLAGDREISLKASDLTLRRNRIPLNPFLSLSPALTLTPPLVKDRLNRESLIFAAKIAPRLFYRAGPLHGFYDLSLTRLIHEYETATNGKSNLQYSLTNWATASFDFTDRFSMNVAGLHSTGFTYGGNSTGKFELSEELEYALTPPLHLVLGHSNAGSLLRPNGQDSNLSFFNPSSSTVYGQVTYEY